MSYNKATLLSYENKLNNYIESTPNQVSGDFKVIIDQSLRNMNKDASILEIGSGTGRDADYIESLGYQVDRTDAANSFIQYQKELGKEVKKLNLMDFTIKKKYDLIFANAVLLHFKVSEFRKIMTKLKNSLKMDGILVFSVKLGQGTLWSSHKINAKRFYKLWEKQELEIELKKLNFHIVSLNIINSKWLFYTVGAINDDS